MLLHAQREGTLVVHIADTRRNFRKAAGSVAVVARVIGLTSGRPGGSLASVTLMGVGRCEVLGLEAGRGRVVTVRVRPYRDETIGERERAAAVELCARVRSLWAEVSDRHRALQDIKLQGKLRRLGGPASAALLGIPTEQLADLRAISKGVPLGEAPEARRPSAGGIEASLAEALDLDELVSQVVHLGATSGALRSGEPGSCLAIDGEAAAEEEEEEAAYASTLSLVALRLTSTADAEEEKGLASEEKDEKIKELDPEPWLGVWRQSSIEAKEFEAMLKNEGVPWALRKVASAIKMEKRYEVNADGKLTCADKNPTGSWGDSVDIADGMYPMSAALAESSGWRPSRSARRS